MQCLRS